MTVIVATYNRSNIVGYAIRSVLAQTRTDWELLVVGDGCTDDTAEVVAAFGDPRIRFINLDPRVGDQSGPTNEGIAHARGRYIALLNHDDIWFPDHLAQLLATLERTRADLAFSMQLEADPNGSWRVNATFPDDTWDPILHPNASAWVFRRELAARVGRLVHRDRVWSYPTRDWLWRAREAGARFAVARAVTVVVISATTRRNVYAERHWHEHDVLWRAMSAEPGFRERRLVEAFLHPAPTHLRVLKPRVLLRALAMRAIGRAAQALGVDPEIVYCYHKFPQRWGIVPARGAVIRELNRRRGLDASVAPRAVPVVKTQGAADPDPSKESQR